MILRPTTSPPQERTPPNEPPVASTPTITKVVSVQPPKPFKVYDENAAPESSEQPGFLEQLKVPTVVLETPSISHTMAAALSLSLLGHTLFLKNQVPFPVAQLSRMPGGKSNPKVAKKRDELIATFDTLASHLQTTFVALSTAYARCRSASSRSQGSSSTDENEDPAGERRHVSAVKEGRRGTAHLMFVLGTSVGAARARILLTIDGLEVKVWGARADGQEDDSLSESEDSDSSEEDDSGSDEGSEDGSEGEAESEVESDEDVSDAESSVSDTEDADSDEDSDLDSGPPLSRSPSPESPLIRSRAPSPELLPSPPVIPTPLFSQQTFTFTVPSPRSATVSENPTPPQPPVSPLPQPPRPTAQAKPAPQQLRAPPSASREVTPTPELSHAQEQQALRAAERLLSRTLMNAWVDGEGDMSSELAPTQTHIYLRAPRRFMHPAWAARQNLTRSLDGVLDGFLEEVGAVPVPAGAKKAKSRGVRTEGAWIGCRGGSAFADKAMEDAKKEDEEYSEGHGEEDDEDEEDEEIWWAWDGKIVGFADW